MSVNIPEWMVKQYNESVIVRFQQSVSKFRGASREQMCTGKIDFWDRLGPTEAYEITTRHADTQIVDTPHSRRACTIRDYGWADLVDQLDVTKVLTNPQSAYVQNCARAMRRKFDLIFIAALNATTTIGEEGASTVTFDADWPNGNRGAGQGDENFTGAALTLANILTMKKELDDNEVDPDGRHLALSPGGMKQLLAQSTAPNVTSSDYSSLQALNRGDINSFLGFTWHISTLLPLSSTTRTCFVWHQDAMGVSIGKDISVSVDKRPDKNNSMQVLSLFSMGACRTQGEGVAQFTINDTL